MQSHEPLLVRSVRVLAWGSIGHELVSLGCGVSDFTPFGMGEVVVVAGLTEAVHWLIDDTFWDQRHPRHDIGTILASTSEADAIAATLEPLIAILDELGPTAPASTWSGVGAGSQGWTGRW
ncbi:hypothetical protein [Micromonospora sp. NPDC047074]|uniref:SCO4402 family protein n=1 Tax=Micromonospora sp. NPDC047074 TaxID=3154339 RepID=UPI0033DCDB28